MDMMNTQELIATHGPREAMDYDVVVVGAGPAGLATAIRLKQLAPDASVVVLEKGSEPGAHILSGAVMDPRAMDELFPDWKNRGAPLDQAVTGDDVLFLSETGSTRTPDWLVPRNLHNDGCYVVSLSNVVKWMAQQAEALGVEIFPGFAAAEVLFDVQGCVAGVATGNMGITKEGEPGENFQLGMELRGKYTVFAEGARGHLGKQLLARYKLTEGRDTQTFAIGIKELWEVRPEQHVKGLVMHTGGWPMQPDTYGGGFVYHLEGNLVSIGYVVGLAYGNPYLSPFEEFQRYKLHPLVKPFLEGGKRIAYGARALTAGGLQALPKLTFPGGALIGCSAGFVNVPRIKGSHNAMKTGMLAAEAAYDAIVNQGRTGHDELSSYIDAYRKSWVYEDLYKVRNVKPALSKFGMIGGTLYGGFDMWMHCLGVKLPWTFHHDKADHEYLRPAAEMPKIDYPKPDGKISFDKLSSVFISNTNHAEDQPCHLKLKDESIPVAVNWNIYAGPEARFCPAGVYEYVGIDEGKPRLQINAQNCVHCKTCDIKDPRQNINWTVPEGGGGPNYPNM